MILRFRGICFRMDTQNVLHPEQLHKRSYPWHGNENSFARCASVICRREEGCVSQTADRHREAGGNTGSIVLLTEASQNVVRETGTDLKKSVIGQIGLGAAGHAIGQMMMRLTGNPVYGADLSAAALDRFEKAGA
jgi:hypothetical protein